MQPTDQSVTLYLLVDIYACKAIFFFVQRRMRFLILGQSVRLKKKNSKKNHMEPQNRRPCYPRMTFKVNIYIFGLTKCTIYCDKNVPVFVPVTVLIFQIKRIISREKWFIYVVTSSFIFLKVSKIWVCQMTLNGEKKRIA